MISKIEKALQLAQELATWDEPRWMNSSQAIVGEAYLNAVKAAACAASEALEERSSGNSVREGEPYSDPRFEALCRDHGIWGTPESALAAVFWRAASKSSQVPQSHDGKMLGWIDMQEWPPVRFKPGCVRADFKPFDGCEIHVRGTGQQVALTEAAVDAYLEDYEWYVESADGREGFYQPNENEKAMIKDAIMGFPVGAK